MPTRWERELRRLREAPVPLEGLRERAQAPVRQETVSRPPSERWIAGIVSLLVVVVVGVLVWDVFEGFGDAGPASAEPPPPVSGPVSLWLSAERVPPGDAELVAMLVDHEGVEAMFGVHALVDRWDGREWVPHGELVMCMDHWHCTARIQPPGEIDGVPGLGLQALPGAPGPAERFSTAGLEVGWYRVSQTANEGVVASGVFEVAAEADPPIPLWNVDAPAISVGPALLPPDGGEVLLYPLVPPGADGSLSREDMLRAVEELSEEARIERWVGSRWELVATIDLARVPGDSLQRTATIPPLAEGAYALVRVGSPRGHVGQFWVDDSV
jgi:hypothetical protein